MTDDYEPIDDGPPSPPGGGGSHDDDGDVNVNADIKVGIELPYARIRDEYLEPLLKELGLSTEQLLAIATALLPPGTIEGDARWEGLRAWLNDLARTTEGSGATLHDDLTGGAQSIRNSMDWGNATLHDDLVAGEQSIRNSLDRAAKLQADTAAAGYEAETAALGKLYQTWADEADKTRTADDTRAATAAAQSAAQWQALVDQLKANGEVDAAETVDLLAAMEREMRAYGESIGFNYGDGEFQIVQGLWGVLQRVLSTTQGKVAAASSIPALQGLINGIGQNSGELAALAAFPVAMAAMSQIRPEEVMNDVNVAIRQFSERMNQSMVEFLDSGNPLDPKDAPGRAGLAMGSAIGMGLAARLWAMAAERFAPGKNMGLTQIAGLLSDMGAFQPISRVYWGHLVDASIGRPLDQHYNRKYPTRMPPLGELLSMARKHVYDRYGGTAVKMPERFVDDLLKLGINQEWARVQYDNMWADPRLYDIVRMAETNLPYGPAEGEARELCAQYDVNPDDPTWWIRLKLKLAGYNSVDIDQLTATALMRLSANERTRLSTQLRNAYRDGRLDEQGFRDRWWDVNHPQGKAWDTLDLEYSLVEVGLQRANDQVDRMIKVYTAQVDAGVLDHDAYRVNIVALHADQDIANALVDAHLATTAAKAFKQEATQDKKDLAAVQKQLAAAYKAQFRKGVIDTPTLAAQLLAIGLAPELVDATVALETANAIKKPSADPELKRAAAELEKAYIAQYRAGKLSEAELEANLLTIGRGAELARAIVARQLARRTAEAAKRTDAAAKTESDRLRTRLVSMLTTWYRKEEITIAEFWRNLVDSGLPDQQARALVSAEAVKLGDDPGGYTPDIPPAPKP